MKNLDGAMLGLIGGFIYLAFAFVMGWEGGGLLSVLAWGSAAIGITLAANAGLMRLLPTANIWLYPFMFCLPTLLFGMVGLADNFTMFIIGLGTFLAGLIASFFMRRHAHNRPPRSNPPVKRDAPPAARPLP